MPGQVITFTSGKGGVGKTTTTANVGTALAALGHRVAVIDADIGLRNLDLVLGLENRIVYDIVDVVEGRARLAQALVRDKRLPELHLLPAAQTRDKTAVNPLQMAQICDALRPRYDFILVDSPAGIEQGFQNAIAGADRIVVVTTPEMSAVRDADRVIGLAQEAQKRAPRPQPAPTGDGDLAGWDEEPDNEYLRLIINRLKPEMVKRGEMLGVDDVLDVLAIPLLGVIPEDEAIIVSTNDGTPVAIETRTLSGRAYQNIARRLAGEEVPFLDLQQRGFLSRLFGFKR